MATPSLVDQEGGESILDGGALEGSLKELVETSSLKWIFVGGKGGVGKTTTSCTLAVQLATRRESVLIISTDPAHNISDAFSQKFTGEPTLVRGFSNLYAMEINTKFQEGAGFDLNKLNAADTMMQTGGEEITNEEGGAAQQGFPNLAQLIPEIVQAVPGIDEALSFAELMRNVQTMKYSVIVFDTAPTGHTLRLLSFPDLLENGLRKVSFYKDRIQSAMKVLNAVSGQKIQENDFAARIENLKALTTSVREAFEDASRTTFVCVCVPEFLSLYETERLIQELAKQRIDCSNIVVNQVLFPIDALYDNVGREDMSPPPDALYPAPANVWTPTNARQLLQDPRAALLLQQPQQHDQQQPSVQSTQTDGKKTESVLKDENEKLRSFLYAVQRRLLALEKSYYSRRAMQSKYLEQIQLLYGDDFHVVAMPQQPQEVRGLDRLREFGELLMRPRPLPIISLHA